MYELFKRLLDVILSLALILVFLPIMILIFLIILVFDKINPIYIQMRVGKNEKQFKLYKFRTMNNLTLDDLSNDKIKEYNKNYKIENDPRVTKIGKILRHTFLDELPQLINVLKGDMSIIGPRPVINEEYKKYWKKTNYKTVKPGLTGNWSIKQDKIKSYKERIICEEEYVSKKSLKNDIKIFFKTIVYVLKINNNFQKLLFIYVLINILGLLTLDVCVFKFQLTEFKMSMWQIGLGVLGLILIIINKLINKTKTNIVDILLLLLVLLGIVSTVFSANVNISLYGTMYRYEGIFMLIYYYILIYICSLINEKYKKIIINAILFTGIIQLMAGYYEIINNLVINIKAGPTALSGHGNFFGTYMTICFTLSLGIFLFTKTKLIYVLLPVLFMSGVFISNALSAFVAVSIILVVLFIICLKRKKMFKKFFVIILFCIIVTIPLYLTNHTLIFDDINNNTNKIVSSVKTKTLSNDLGTNRMFIWKSTLNEVPDHMLHGVGVDCFIYAFNNMALINTNNLKYFDKAHNEYLQKLITEGIFSLLAYLLLLGIVIFKAVKSNSVIRHIILLTVIAYMIQAFFNISVINVAPIYYILIGLLVNRNDYSKH